MNTLERSKVRDYLLNLNGKFFTIQFIKRSNGELRTMNCTTNYRSHLAGGQASYDFQAKNLLPVWDLKSKGFRSIPLEGVISITSGGLTIEVVD